MTAKLNVAESASVSGGVIPTISLDRGADGWCSISMDNRAEIVGTLETLSRAPELYAALKKLVLRRYSESLKSRYEKAPTK